MKKEDLVAKGLTPEQADAVLAIYTEELKGFIPKSRFDEVNDAKKELTTQLADRDNVDIPTLKSMLEKKIRDKRYLDLLFKVIGDGDKGIPKGFYVSPLLSHFYLLPLDSFITQKLKGKYMSVKKQHPGIERPWVLCYNLRTKKKNKWPEIRGKIAPTNVPESTEIVYSISGLIASTERSIFL